MKKIVYDLDGTLIPFNTFKGWIILSIIMPLLCFNFKIFNRVCELVLSRALNKIDRLTFKEKLLIEQQEDLFWGKIGSLYASLLMLFVRRRLLNEKKQNDLAYLATAAPSIYAKYLSKKIGIFSISLSTDISNELKMIEVFGEKKKEMVLEALMCPPDIFYTDHYDDAPLAKVSKKTYFIKPSVISKEKILSDKNIGDYEIIK
ncbi:haloacid dehalogenase-like hydrolase [Klebsiella quasipneumoniae]|uniref:HAD family hydrolase n=1 Tax=Klebsiella/Raoultella group TaxID=2890311 RepID=UPI001CD2F484|nr:MULTISPECIES: HAD family hydrolase [Klebsiella/Raoultella group]MCH2027890.1 haloacid dehalogenase-like hydrolase [Klebsiella quasipneumoniae]MCQ3866397.1 haloacid dehalogenase-like hydrolase [Klebsiella quasipneumoniae]MEB4600392.1 haloacid dehalogenase-like hydrolase [Raoultella ornithinolytica]HDS8992546.1 haloacid dehalogenase-like hydrolase [Klebsiella pneumoniae subsp. pneumoniae]